MSESPYASLLAAPVPRPKALVGAYVERGTTSHRKTAWGFVGLFIAFALLSSYLYASGTRTSSFVVSFATCFILVLLASMVFAGPVLLFWSVNKTALHKHLRGGHVHLAGERSRDLFYVKGAPFVRVVVEFGNDPGPRLACRFEVPLQEGPIPGAELRVLFRVGTTAAVLWPYHGVALGRIVSP